MREDMKNFANPDVNKMPFALQCVGTSYCDETYHMVRAKARVNVIEYVISGTGTVETSTEKFTASAGDSFLLHAGEWHNYYSDPDDPWVKIWFNAFGLLPTHILNSYGFDHSMLFPNLDLSSYIKRIHDISLSTYTDMYEMYDRCCKVFLELCQYMRQELLTAQYSYLPPSVPANIAQLKTYIDLNLNEPLTLEKCNSITCLSTSQTIRSFRQAYGMPPYEYLNLQRVDAAKILLKTSPLSIQEIATQVGFDDQNYFSKYFKKKVGKSPKHYRDAYLQKEKGK